MWNLDDALTLSMDDEVTFLTFKELCFALSIEKSHNIFLLSLHVTRQMTKHFWQLLYLAQRHDKRILIENHNYASKTVFKRKSQKMKSWEKVILIKEFLSVKIYQLKSAKVKAAKVLVSRFKILREFVKNLSRNKVLKINYAKDLWRTENSTSGGGGFVHELCQNKKMLAMNNKTFFKPRNFRFSNILTINKNRSICQFQQQNIRMHRINQKNAPFILIRLIICFRLWSAVSDLRFLLVSQKRIWCAIYHILPKQCVAFCNYKHFGKIPAGTKVKLASFESQNSTSASH